MEGDWEGEVEKAIRAEALARAEVAETEDLDNGPPVERFWSVWIAVWALSLAPAGICVVFLIKLASLLYNSPTLLINSVHTSPNNASITNHSNLDSIT